MASTRKSMIMSTTMASEAEIKKAVATRGAGCKDPVLLHCISSYPAPMDQANLRQIPELAKRFGVLTGLSDHTMGTTVSVAAIALGTCLIEKHFTLSRADKGPDSEFSLEPFDLERLCNETKEAWQALGKPGFERQQAEERSEVFRRFLYFVKDLPARHVYTEGDIPRIRPEMGLAPKFFDTLIRKKTKVAVARGSSVTENTWC